MLQSWFTFSKFISNHANWNGRLSCLQISGLWAILEVYSLPSPITTPPGESLMPLYTLILQLRSKSPSGCGHLVFCYIITCSVNVISCPVIVHFILSDHTVSDIGQWQEKSDEHSCCLHLWFTRLHYIIICCVLRHQNVLNVTSQWGSRGFNVWSPKWRAEINKFERAANDIVGL